MTFVHVVDADEFHGGRLGTVPITHSEPVDESETVLKNAGDAAVAAGVSCTLERIAGETVDSIVAMADTKNVDLIVLGSRGRNAVTSAPLAASRTACCVRLRGRCSL